jgi:hypothetical protein
MGGKRRRAEIYIRGRHFIHLNYNNLESITEQNVDGFSEIWYVTSEFIDWQLWHNEKDSLRLSSQISELQMFVRVWVQRKMCIITES